MIDSGSQAVEETARKKLAWSWKQTADASMQAIESVAHFRLRLTEVSACNGATGWCQRNDRTSDE